MAERKIVLVVNQEKILVDLLVRSLAGDDLAVFGASGIVEAGRLFEHHKPDLLIVDPAMPGGPGLIEDVRNGIKPARVVAIVDSEDGRQQAAASGVERVLDKNQGFDALLDAIRTSLDSALAAAGQRDRILIVDDEDQMRNLLEEFLGGLGYSVVSAADGRQGVEKVRVDPTLRLVLLDVTMPLMGGMEALRQIMELPGHPDVIMMTALADREVARRALQIGAFDYVLKPFDLNSIEASIVACISYSEYHRQPWWKRLVRRGA